MARYKGIWLITALMLDTLAIATSSPTCQQAAPPQSTLSIPTSNLSVPDSPFGIVYAKDSIALVALGSGIGVLDTSAFKPTLVRTASFQNDLVGLGENALHGLAITQDKKTLFAATGVGALVINVNKVISGQGNAVLGVLQGKAGSSAIEVTLSKEDDFAFISQEYGSDITGNRGAIEVFKLHGDGNSSISSTYVGYTTLGNAVVGSALSLDGTALYVTSEISNNTGSSNGSGSLSVLSVAKLKTTPANAILATVDAGCQPVRVLASPGGTHIWVTARNSNKLLAFDAAKLMSNPSHALLAEVQVGTSPVGSVLIKDDSGEYIITADSNRFNYTGATTGLTVVNTTAALGGVRGFPRISTGLFPREFGVSPDGRRVLLGQYGSKAIQALNVGEIIKNIKVSS